jgi:hypothetical protein
MISATVSWPAAGELKTAERKTTTATHALRRSMSASLARDSPTVFSSRVSYLDDSAPGGARGSLQLYWKVLVDRPPKREARPKHMDASLMENRATVTSAVRPVLETTEN